MAHLYYLPYQRCIATHSRSTAIETCRRLAPIVAETHNRRRSKRASRDRDDARSYPDVALFTAMDASQRFVFAV